jgi:hypothetical protein
MEPIEGSETSAFKPQTPGKYPNKAYLYRFHLPKHLPRKMEPIEGSGTSAFKPQTPGKYPKENILQRIFFSHRFGSGSKVHIASNPKGP